MSSTLVFCVPLFKHKARNSLHRNHYIFQYPQHKKLINRIKTHIDGQPYIYRGCDTYDVTTICSNCRLSQHQTSKVGIIRWECMGHKKK
jgi:hypothetical protein